mmetsp:Transcript_11399/g.18899  ORF Transcript_11399/g.18899 Transcript_11399/m.18899 type:complete len:427 (+) Transcript_11399:84-1364(+)
MPTIVELLASRGNYDEEIEKFIQDMPKIELHVHLDGSFDPEILYRHLQDNHKNDYECLPVNSVLPWDQSLWPVRQLVKDCESMVQFHSICTCRGKRSLQEMIKCFEIFTPLVRGNLQLIEDLAYDFVRRQAEQRVVYTEARYSPHLLAAGASLTGNDPVDARPVVDAVTQGLRRGSTDFGIVVNQILCCICWRPDWADDVVELASKRRDDFPCAVVAVDIAAGEEHFDAANFQHLHEPHLRAMKKAQRLNVNITMHAGEVAGGENVLAAIRQYGATRIGHGYRAVDNSEVMKELKDKNIHIETCPTSSRETGGWDFKNGTKDWTKHPCLSMIENGLSVSFNSDDPAVFNTSLSWQYRTVIAKMKAKKEILLAATKAGIDAAFCSEEEKQTYRNIIVEFEKGNSPTVGNVIFRDRVIDNRLIPGESM